MMAKWRPTRLARAWSLAAEDLGIEFTSPFQFIGRDGQSHTCSGLVKYFGTVKGTLIVSRDDPEMELLDEMAEGLGFHLTALSPFHYERYDRTAFVEALKDWGWFGPIEERPAWLGESAL
jgi:hypothetical protein